MKTIRIITVEGDPEWVLTTMKNSLPEGHHTKLFGESTNRIPRYIDVQFVDPITQKITIEKK